MEDVQNNYKCDLEAGENTCQGQNERVQSVISPKRELERRFDYEHFPQKEILGVKELINFVNKRGWSM